MKQQIDLLTQWRIAQLGACMICRRVYRCRIGIAALLIRPTFAEETLLAT